MTRSQHMRSIEKAEEKRRNANKKTSDVPTVKTIESKKKRSPAEKKSKDKQTRLMITDATEKDTQEARYTRKDFNGIQKKSIREMAYSEEVERLSDDSYRHVATDLLGFTKRLGDVAGEIARYDGRRCTVSPSDISLALKFMGKNMYF